jgi:hypothetical protein
MKIADAASKKERIPITSRFAKSSNMSVNGAPMMRYISRGMGSQDAYVFFGALGAILIMIRLFVMRGGKKPRS